MRYSTVLAGLLCLAGAAPAVSQEAPVIKKPPIAGSISGSRTCIQSNPMVQQGSVMRQVKRGGLAPRPVPAAERVPGSASVTVARPVVRTFLKLRLGVQGETLPAVANSLRAARDQLAQTLADAGHRVLSVETSNAMIEAAQPGRRSASGSARVSLLVEGEVAEPEMRRLIGAAGGGRIERLVFDFANADAVAEDMRLELERQVLADAAARAVEDGAEPVALLSSRMTHRGGRLSGTSIEAGELTITAQATYRMAPIAAGEKN